MKESNKERELLTALDGAYKKLEKYMPKPLENHEIPSPVSFEEMKRDFDDFRKIEKEYLQFCKQRLQFGGQFTELSEA